MAGKIFINYRRDIGVRDAQLLYEILKALFPERQLFIDLEGLNGGVNWMHELQRQVAASDVMVTLIGKGWLDARDKQGGRRLDDRNDFVRFEISEALRREIPVLPVLIDGEDMPKADQLPQELALLTYLQAMPLRTISFKEDAARIGAAIKQLLGRRRRHGVSPQLATLAIALSLFGGAVAGPFVLDRLRIGFPGVPNRPDEKLREAQEETLGAKRRTAVAEQAQAQAERKLADKSAKLDTLQRDLASGQQALLDAQKQALEAKKKTASAEQAQTQAERALADKSAKLETAQRDLANAAQQLEQIKKRLAEQPGREQSPEAPAPQATDKASAAIAQPVPSSPLPSSTTSRSSDGCRSYFNNAISIETSTREETPIAGPKLVFRLDTTGPVFRPHTTRIQPDYINLPIDEARSKPQEGKFFITPVFADPPHNPKRCWYFSKVGEELVASQETTQQDAFGIIVHLRLNEPVHNRNIRFLGRGSYGPEFTLTQSPDLVFVVHLSGVALDTPHWSRIDGEIAYVFAERSMVAASPDQPQPTPQRPQGEQNTQ